MNPIVLLILAVSLVIYFIPTIIAHDRRHPNFWQIFALNLFGGFSGGVLWVIALVWALQPGRRH